MKHLRKYDSFKLNENNMEEEFVDIDTDADVIETEDNNINVINSSHNNKVCEIGEMYLPLTEEEYKKNTISKRFPKNNYTGYSTLQEAMRTSQNPDYVVFIKGIPSEFYSMEDGLIKVNLSKSKSFKNFTVDVVYKLRNN